MSENRYFFKLSYLTLKEDILCQKEDGRIWPKKEDMSSQRRTYGNPSLKDNDTFIHIFQTNRQIHFQQKSIEMQLIFCSLDLIIP
jgi:hypothetical protein